MKSKNLVNFAAFRIVFCYSHFSIQNRSVFLTFWFSGSFFLHVRSVHYANQLFCCPVSSAVSGENPEITALYVGKNKTLGMWQPIEIFLVLQENFKLQRGKSTISRCVYSYTDKFLFFVLFPAKPQLTTTQEFLFVSRHYAPRILLFW